jgi:hypothetical protein
MSSTGWIASILGLDPDSELRLRHFLSSASGLFTSTLYINPNGRSRCANMNIDTLGLCSSNPLSSYKVHRRQLTPPPSHDRLRSGQGDTPYSVQHHAVDSKCKDMGKDMGKDMSNPDGLLLSNPAYFDGHKYRRLFDLFKAGNSKSSRGQHSIYR